MPCPLLDALFAFPEQHHRLVYFEVVDLMYTTTKIDKGLHVEHWVGSGTLQYNGNEVATFKTAIGEALLEIPARLKGTIAYHLGMSGQSQVEYTTTMQITAPLVSQSESGIYTVSFSPNQGQIHGSFAAVCNPPAIQGPAAAPQSVTGTISGQLNGFTMTIPLAALVR
jgi:hypothetical protein